MTAENPQHVDRDGLIDILQREAIVRVPYVDDSKLEGRPPGPDAKWSQGVGSQTNYRVNPPRAVRPDDPPMTIAEAIEGLEKAVASREPTINKKLKVHITQHQFNALHSIYYQFGTEALNEIAELFNAGKPWQAVLAFAKYPFGQNRVPTEGHAKRRAGEISMAGFGYYDDQEKIPVFDTNPYALPSSRRSINASDLAL